MTWTLRHMTAALIRISVISHQQSHVRDSERDRDRQRESKLYIVYFYSGVCSRQGLGAHCRRWPPGPARRAGSHSNYKLFNCQSTANQNDLYTESLTQALLSVQVQK